MGIATAVAVTSSALVAPVGTSVEVDDAPTTMALTLSVEGGPPGLEAFLVERARETWDTSVDIPRRNRASLPNPVVSGDRRSLPYFYVEIDWLSGGQVTVTVEQGGELLTRRTIEVEDPTEARLTLWLLLKSTINRGLKQIAQAPLADAEPTAAIEPEPATLPDVGEAPGTAGSVRATPEGPTLAGEAAAPVTLRVAPWVTVWLETPRLLSAGAEAVATWYWRFLAVALQLGYRYAPGPDGLEVHTLPLTGTVAFEVGEQIRAGLGGLLSGAVKIPVSHTRASVRLGAEGGVFAQARMDLAAEWEIALRFGIVWRMVRLQYLYHDSAGQLRRTREAPWTTMLGVGVAWR